LPLALYTAIQTPDGDAAAARLAALSVGLGLAGLALSEWLARSVRKRLEP
jgi:molybdate transport system permease protein